MYMLRPISVYLGYLLSILVMGASSALVKGEENPAILRGPGAGQAQPPPKRQPSAHALNSWDCSGTINLVNDKCGNVSVYVHVCYGPNGQDGATYFSIPPMEVHQLHVQQYSTFTSACGTILPVTCPAGMGPLPLDHCD